jgi:hypothetical protein
MPSRKDTEGENSIIMSIIFIITSFKPLKKSTTGFAFSSSIKIRPMKNYEKYNLQHATIVTQSFEKLSGTISISG